MHSKIISPMLSAFLAVAIFLSNPVAAVERLQDSQLFEKLTAHLQAHPETTLEEAAALANELLEQHGINYEFDTRDDERLEAFDITLSAGPHSFVTDVWAEAMAGPCGERWTVVPAKHVDQAHIAIVQKGQTFIVDRPHNMELDTFTIFAPDGTTQLHEIYVPWQTLPREILADGRAVTIYHSLDDSVAEWWARINAAHPDILIKNPHIMLAVGVDGIRFLGDPAHYAGHKSTTVDKMGRETKERFTGRERFDRTGFVVEFASPCT